MLVYELIEHLKKCDKSAEVFLRIEPSFRSLKNITVTKSLIMIDGAKNRITLEG